MRLITLHRLFAGEEGEQPLRRQIAVNPAFIISAEPAGDADEYSLITLAEHPDAVMVDVRFERLLELLAGA